MRSSCALVPALALLVACAEPSPTARRPRRAADRAGGAADAGAGAAPARPAPDPTRYLGADVDKLVPRRARLAARGPVRFAAGGEAVSQGRRRRGVPRLAGAPTYVVVETTDDLARIVAEEDSARLLLWVRQADLHRVATETSTLGLEPGAPPSREGVGVTVYPGLPLLPGELREGFSRVRYHDHDVVFTGWIAEGDFGVFYVPVDPEPPGEPDGFVNVPASILGEPGGRELARLARGSQAVEVLGTEAGHAHIVLAGEGYRVRGFVEAGIVRKKKLGPGGGGWGYGVGGGGSGGRRLDVPAGACLFSSAGGSIVGRMVEAKRFLEAGRVDAFSSIRLHTRWGVLDVWVERRGEGRYRDCR